jgi:aryl-alcohol dehydrogenase-like predicted oxidoreductase
MNKRKLGFSDLNVTTVGLGTWAIGGGGWEWGWGPQDDDESIAALRRGMDKGLNWIDTAAAYGLGRAEEVVGKAIKGRRDEMIVATKCGLVWEEGSPLISQRLKADSVRAECEASLRRLDVEIIDLYQIHWPIPDEDIEEGWGTIADLVKEGKVRFAGVSNANVEQMKRLQPIHPIASLQPPYSMLERGVEEELLGFCAANNIGVVCYSPMQNGLLTGKYTKEKIAAMPDEDWRKERSPHFKEPQLSANLALVDSLRPIAERHGKTVAQLSIAWVLRRPEVTSAIVGSRRPSHIDDIAGAADWELGAEEIAEIDALLAERDRAAGKAGGFL